MCITLSSWGSSHGYRCVNPDPPLYFQVCCAQSLITMTTAYITDSPSLLGLDSKMGLIMTSYEPRVKCDVRPPKRLLPTARCKRLIDTMLTTAKEQYFGNANNRQTRPDVTLPRYLREGTLATPAPISYCGVKTNVLTAINTQSSTNV